MKLQFVKLFCKIIATRFFTPTRSYGAGTPAIIFGAPIHLWRVLRLKFRCAKIIVITLIILAEMYGAGSASTITVLFTSSSNGRLSVCPTCPNLLYGGMPRRATLIKEYRNKYKNILLLDSGDLFPVVAPKEQTECALKTVNLMKYDAMAIGDQEFIYGKEFLLYAMKKVDFPFLCATIAYTKSIVREGVRPELFAKPYIIKEIEGIKVLIIGVISEKAFLFFPKEKIEGLTVLEPLRALREIISKLRPTVDLVIVLSHLGDVSDERLAREVEGIDLIIGGHTQTLLEKPLKVDNTIIVQAGRDGERLGEITLEVAKRDSPSALGEPGQLPTIENYKLTLLDEKISDDPEIAKIVNEFYIAQMKVRTIPTTPETVPVKKFAPSLLLITPELDLGMVEKGKVVEGEIQLKNTGDDTLTIKKIRSSCDCLVASAEKEFIPPGAKSFIKLKFSSGDVIGETFVYNVYIESDDPDGPVSMVFIKGSVREVVATARQEQTPAIETSKEKILAILPTTGGRLPVLFFYSPGCYQCEEIKDDFFPLIKKKYGETIEIKEYDISKKENYEILVELEEKYKVRQSAPMEVFVGDQYLLGSKEIRNKLELIISKILTGREKPAPTLPAISGNIPMRAETENKIVQRFKSFGPLAIILAGLLDGINPCAFATIIFFISFLTYIGRSKKDILLNGIFFSAGVFCAYFLLGIGLFKVLQNLLVFKIASTIVFYAIFALTLSLGCFSLYDAYIFKKTGDTAKITLQLPRSVKENIHFWIRKNISTSLIIVSAFTTGLLISVLEAICTGQIYLPTIAFMTREPTLATMAYFYLVLYNLMFVVPLLVVFLLAFLGVGSKTLAQFSQKHLFLIKILTAIFFFGLAVLLVALR